VRSSVSECRGRGEVYAGKFSASAEEKRRFQDEFARYDAVNLPMDVSRKTLVDL